MRDNPLETEIRRRVARDGPMTYATFMQLALYDPEQGFYSDPARGPGSDYRTSPGITPTFGHLIAKQLETLWLALDRPDPLTVLEVGGGRGDLAAAAMQTSELPLEWVFVERSSRVKASQEERFDSTNVSWRPSLRDGHQVTGVVLANEVLDNFPIHQCEVTEDRVCEVLVGVQGGRLVEVLGPPSSPALAEQMREPAEYLEVGDRFEICLGLPGWCQEVAGALERGYLLVIDYGDLSPSLWTQRPSGSLISYRNEQITTVVLEDPGEADITSHVDFSKLQRASESSGMQTVFIKSQSDFLKALGIEALANDLREEERSTTAEGRNSDALRLTADRGRVHLLYASPGLGDLKVFMAAKGAPADGVVI